MSSSNDSNSTSTAQPPSERRASFLSSLFSMQSSSAAPDHVPRHNSFSSSSGSTSTSTTSVSPPYSTHPQDDANLSGSPASSFASPLDSKFSPTDWNSSPRSRQPSLTTGSLTGLTSSFRWPGSSNVQPISIPNSNPSADSQTNHAPQTIPTSMVGCSAPTRRTSVGGPAFRRAFELPTYTNTYDLPNASQDSKPDSTRRGRSGSLFSSFGVASSGDASKRTSGPPRRKLSPMGERMIRDHPF
ncbi:uncharacterized protein VP01_2518g3 [Puccinia sorghi]|uniref:Uncharacterized protein n=1 Tax=Puccinia sorghi TaxID=27349 RepID=A0A0L6V5J5_9BASI|nr:uncharacterized protein VP01_2518g3 [Puccinia sorghi]